MEADRLQQNKISQLKRYLISQVDFKNCYGIAEYILEKGLYGSNSHSNRYLLEGMCVGMIVAYCRPFSGNKGAPDLPSKYSKRLLNSKEQELHSLALKLRSSALAHSDNDSWEMEPHYMIVDNDKILVPFHNCVHDPISKSVTQELQQLAKKQWKQCIKDQKKLEKEIGDYLPIFNQNA